MKSLKATQKLKLSRAQVLAVGSKRDALALEHGWMVTCHSLVAQIKKRAAIFRSHVPACDRSFDVVPTIKPGSEVAPYQFECTVFIWRINVATAIAELETGCSASPVARDPHAFRRYSYSQTLFSAYRRNSHILHLREFGPWVSISDDPT